MDVSVDQSTSAQKESTPTLKGSAVRKSSPGFGLFGRRWTSEDYRNLEYGIIGTVSTRRLFSKIDKITVVFPDCPAALAGIRPGDVIVQIADHVLKGKDTQRTTWNVADGKAGTKVDYIVRRHGELITFNLTRMNIEDIRNNGIRRMYERMLRELGPPGSNAKSDSTMGASPTGD
jgi:membrane-associated protease RseP (regulator of RpoE activity)